MAQEQSLPIAAGHTQALLFTDSRGQVVFVDNNFLRLMDRSQAGGIVGSPLYTVMGVEPDVASELLRDASREGAFSGRLVDLRADSGTMVRVSCSGVATYDERNAFIGADFTLVEQADAPPPTAAPAPQVSSDMRERMADDASVLRVYFISVMQALRDLLERTGGDRPRQTVDRLVNDTANRSEWPVLIQAGKIYVEIRKNEGEVYRGLLARAISYATDVIGTEMVRRTIAQLDKQTDSATLDLASRSGLRDLIQSQ